MAFDLDKFYEALDTYYAGHDLEKTEKSIRDRSMDPTELWLPELCPGDGTQYGLCRSVQ